MRRAETQEILKGVEAALDVYRRNEGRLSAWDVRIKSMLSVVRTELLTELGAEHSSATQES